MIQRLREGKLYSHTMKKQKLFQKILMKRKQPVKTLAPTNESKEKNKNT